ncbi:DUF4255 domain-containing protein [Agrobacterium tumefaciens]|nr:DUF4255 domain-containing protein [Agrobacterium tumefaciens]NTE21014.1 DUF4255 domain-containing protein [Agrobacterium tumefaciens]
MINEALQFTNNVLNQFLKNRFNLDDSRVVLNNLIESNGAIPERNQNKIVISLINIERETTKPFYNRNQQLLSGNYGTVNPEERYNLDILISSNFDDYAETLKFLNEVILFFQLNNSLDASVSSLIPSGIHKLDFEIEKMTYHQMQSLWTAMGAKYQPSVIYKMKLITLQGNEMKQVIPEIVQSTNSLLS